MSQPYNATQAEEIKSTAEVVAELYMLVAIATLLPIYEFVITFDQEVASVWASTKKLSFGSLLLVSTRWCMVLAAVMVCLPDTMTSCKPIAVAVEFLQLAGFTQVAVFSALRVSAIWERNWMIFFVVLALGLTTVVTNIFEALHYTYSFEEGTCISNVGLRERTQDIDAQLIDQNREVSFVSRIPAIMADVLVLVLTWIKTYKQVMGARRAGQTMSVSLFLLRDGTIYFVILLALNLFELPFSSRRLEHTIFSTLMASAPPILVSRFMLNLRQIHNNNGTQTIGRLSTFSSVQFRAAESIFGNLGEPLDHGESLLVEGEDERGEEQDPIDEMIHAGDPSRARNDGLPLGRPKYGALQEGEASTSSSIEGITEVFRTEEPIF